MKKNYLVLVSASILIGLSGFAQQRTAKAKKTFPVDVPSVQQSKSTVQPLTVTDTITNHWDIIAPSASQIDTPTIYTVAVGGYVAGHNGYSDIAKAQKFDSFYGVTSAGTIKSLLIWVGDKMVGAGTAAFTPTIWSDNAGKPGAVLGTAPAITVANMDTSLAALKRIGPSTAVEGRYNVIANFSPAVSIPANQIFYAGFTMTYTAGDSAGVISSRDLDTNLGVGNFIDANLYTFEQWSDNSWHDFASGWKLEVALAVYPIVDFSVGVKEQNANILSIYNMPNPAKEATTIHYELKDASDVSVSILDITGKEILNLNQGVQASGQHSVKIDVSDFANGMYFYALHTENGTVTHKLVVAK